MNKKFLLLGILPFLFLSCSKEEDETVPDFSKLWWIRQYSSSSSFPGAPNTIYNNEVNGNNWAPDKLGITTKTIEGQFPYWQLQFKGRSGQMEERVRLATAPKNPGSGTFKVNGKGYVESVNSQLPKTLTDGTQILEKDQFSYSYNADDQLIRFEFDRQWTKESDGSKLRSRNELWTFTYTNKRVSASTFKRVVSEQGNPNTTDNEEVDYTYSYTEGGEVLPINPIFTATFGTDLTPIPMHPYRGACMADRMPSSATYNLRQSQTSGPKSGNLTIVNNSFGNYAFSITRGSETVGIGVGGGLKQ